MDIAALKTLLAGEVDARYPELEKLSCAIHDNPETAFKETGAVASLTAFLRANGFTVETGICRLKTAFKAVYGTGRPLIAFLAEYDALPKVGHGCGHNLIGTASSAAAVAARKAVDEYGGTVVVFGTPGEELYGGKSIMAERGAFTDVDFAMITHPGGGDQVLMSTLACETLTVEFFGKAAHAAGEPEKGINALEAMILSFNAIDALRQHVPEKSRIHGVITDGGEAANVVPAHTAGTFIARSETDDLLEDLKKRVIACFTGAAKMTGARLKYSWGEHYAAMRSNGVMGRLFKENLAAVGRSIPLGANNLQTFSTDVGNVSQLVPTIQPLVGIAPPDVQLHSPDFTAAAGTEEALRTLLDAARAMAMTAADLLADPAAAERAREEFRARA
jgi:amidohydrolase